MKIDFTPFFAQQGDQPFTSRRAVMPWRNRQPIPPHEVQQNWQQLTQTVLPKNKRLIYLHIPFCETHCTFCGFYQNRYSFEDAEAYVPYLLKELDREIDSPMHQQGLVHAIYFGGGTPTALSAQSLYKLIHTLKSRLPLAGDCEITIEGRIKGFDDEKIDACLQAGANRFSIGIQTFDTKIRQRMARTSTGDEAIKFLTRLGERDNAAVVCDLIYGLPRQTEQTWQKDLEIIAQLPLDGVDLYALNLLPTTPLAKASENQRVTLPDFIERKNFYLQGAEYLQRLGCHQLSNSHWAKTTRERNLYNLLIKRGADCFAFGSSSGGNIMGQAYMMQRDLGRYYAAVDNNEKPIMMMTAASDKQGFHQKLQAGIEVARVDLVSLMTNAELLQPLVSQWYQSGLLKDNSLCLRLTNDGRFWSSNILEALQQAIPLAMGEMTQPQSEMGHLG